MSRILCLNSFEELSDLIRGESEIIEASFVDYDICNNPDNRYLQITPYVTFYTAIPSEGKILLIQYKRTAKDTEDSKPAEISFGFGGPVDLETEIEFQNSYVTEDTSTSYNTHYELSKENLTATCLTTAKRKLSEQLGSDILSAIGADLDFNEAAFFPGDPRVPADQVRLGLAIPVKLTNEQFTKLIAIAEVKPEEIEILDKMTINIHHIVEEMDITVTNNKIMQQMRKEHNVEDWAVRVFDFVVRKEIGDIMKNINYSDLYRLSVAKEQAHQAKQAQLAATPQAVTEDTTPAVDEGQPA